MSHGIDPTFGWHEIADHEVVLRGVDPFASLTLRTNHVLACQETIGSPRAVAFTAEISLPNHNAPPNTYSYHFGFYGGSLHFRDAVARLRKGLYASVQIEGAEGFELELFEDSRIGGCVCGSYFSPLYPPFMQSFPKPTPLAHMFRVTDTTAAHSLQFGFRTSFVDPPYLDEFIHGLDALLEHLELYN